MHTDDVLQSWLQNNSQHTVNTCKKAALTERPHPEFGTSNFGKKFLGIKIGQK